MFLKILDRLKKFAQCIKQNKILYFMTYQIAKGFHQ